MARPFFDDKNQHADGPPRRFGTGAVPVQVRPAPTPQQLRERHVHPVGVLPALQSLLYVLVIALFLMTFTVQPIRIPSGSMEPTLLVGDFLLLDKQAVGGDAGGLLPPVGIGRGDIVVFHDPVDDPSVHLVKRVIGIPGDRIHLREGVVIRNGRALTEPYAVHRAAAPDLFRDNFPMLASMDPGVNAAWWMKLHSLARGGEVQVPAGEYFVMGDNRNDSEDSRYWGFVPEAEIVGKPVMVYFSLREARPAGEEGSGGMRERSTGPTDFARWDRTFTVVR